PLAAAQVPAPPREGKDTPKIAVGMGDGGGFVGGGGGRGAGRGGAAGGAGAGTAGGASAGAPGTPAGGAGGNPPDPSAGPRRIKQLGVDNVLGGGGPAPWTDESLNATMERWKAAG